MLRPDADSTPPTAQDVLGPFEYRFSPRSSASIRLSRNVFAQWLQAQPAVNVDAIDDVLVAASELCTNAVRHATRPACSVAIRAAADGESLMFEVEDDGEGFDDPGAIDLRDVDPESDHGRGLFIVQRLVDDVQFEREPGRMLVRCWKQGMLGHAGDPAAAALSDQFQR